MSQLRFKGGPTHLNCGGTGPDDYLLKPIKGGRWTLITFRWGRNWTGDNEAAQADRDAMKKIFPVQQICVPDNAKRLAKMKASSNVPTMHASEFWQKYKDKPTVRSRF